MKKVSKAMKSVGFLCKFQFFLPRSSLLTIYKSSIRPQMSYEDVIYGQPSNATFSSKTELVEYSVVLASPASASIRGCSQKKN